MVAGVIGTCIGPFAGDGLDKTFGLAIGLRAVRTSESMLEAKLVAGLGEEFGAVGGAAVSEDALDADAMSLVESDGLLESGQDTGSFFIREEGGKSQAGMIIDGDVKGFDPGTRITMRAVARGADTGLVKTAKFFNIKVKELAGSGAFVAHGWRPGRVEGSQAIKTMAAQDAGESGFGNRQSHEDLSVGTALSAQGQDLIF